MKKAEAPAQSRWSSCRAQFQWMAFLLGGCCVLALIASPVRAQTLTFTTLAGPPGGPGSRDGTGSVARFSGPYGVAIDGDGNLYLADSENSTIRKITPAGVVTTLAGLAGATGYEDGSGGTARFHFPVGVATDNGGNVYVADSFNSTIRKITPWGTVTTLAGYPTQLGSADGTGGAARFQSPQGLATDDSGNIYVADSFNHTIRKITPAGVVTTLAGQAGLSGSADGIGPEARFKVPRGLATDGSGNVYVADEQNGLIRKVTPAGVVMTLAGAAGQFGSADGTGSAARFGNLYAVTSDRTGNLYVADLFTVRKITPAGVVTTLAGRGGFYGTADGTGSAARFRGARGVVLDGFGNVYVADGDTIRKINPAAVVTTLAGLPRESGSADGTGSAGRFNQPLGVATDSSANVYVADTYNYTIRKITPAGVVSTLAGSAGQSGAGDGTGSNARFGTPSGVATDGGGNVYVADSSNHTIRRISPAGVVTTPAGLAGVSGTADGLGGAARFKNPQEVATDGDGNIYVADRGNHIIRKITPVGGVTTLAGAAGFPGSADGSGSAARFNSPDGVATDSAGNVYVAESYTIRKITPAGVVTTFAGSAGVPGNLDGTGSAARFNGAEGVATDSGGNVYVVDGGNYLIRKITPAGVVTTLAGSLYVAGSEDGTGGVARFNSPHGAATDSSGNVYVADEANGKIRIGRPALADTATIDSSIGAVSTTRQLNTSPQSATSWQWRIIRQPSGSTATLSSLSIRNPVFTPDVADLYVFELTASNGVNTSITTVSLTATPVPPRRRAVRH